MDWLVEQRRISGEGPAGQRDGVLVLLRLRADGLDQAIGDALDYQTGVARDQDEGDRHEEDGYPVVPPCR